MNFYRKKICFYYPNETKTATWASKRNEIVRLQQEKQQHYNKNKGKRNVQEVPQSQTAALPRHQEEEETDKPKQAQIEQTYKTH